jgi:hypothetical protein
MSHIYLRSRALALATPSATHNTPRIASHITYTVGDQVWGKITLSLSCIPAHKYSSIVDSSQSLLSSLWCNRGVLCVESGLMSLDEQEENNGSWTTLKLCVPVSLGFDIMFDSLLRCGRTATCIQSTACP